MAAIDWTHVEDHAPSLNNVDPNAQQDILAHVNTTLEVADFGGETAGKLKLARVYLACHFGTLSLVGSTGAAGPVISEEAGDLKRQYGGVSAAVAGSDYGSTAFGQLFRALVRTTPARSPLVI